MHQLRLDDSDLIDRLIDVSERDTVVSAKERSEEYPPSAPAKIMRMLFVRSTVLIAILFLTVFPLAAVISISAQPRCTLLTTPFPKRLVMPPPRYTRSQRAHHPVCRKRFCPLSSYLPVNPCLHRLRECHCERFSFESIRVSLRTLNI